MAQGVMSEHPALSTVLWTAVAGRVEMAEYRGHRLLVRHVGEFHIGQMHMGFVNERPIGTRQTMPQICELLFNTVDRMIETQQFASPAGS